MKRTMTRLFSLVLVAVMLMGAVPAQAFAPEETEVYLPELAIGSDILDYDVFYLASASASIPENGGGVYLLRVGRGGPADSESSVLVKIADMTAKYGEDYVVRVRGERTRVENPEDNVSMMEMLEGADFEQQAISDSDEFADMMEDAPEAQAVYQESVETAMAFLDEASGLKDKYADENPYSEAVEELYGNAGAIEADVEAVPALDGETAWDEGAIPAIENGEVITIGDDRMDYDPVQQAANLFTGESATAQRLTTEGDMFQDLQAVANVLTNVVVGASVELTFAPGETEKYLEIVPKDNRTGDGDRMFYVILGAPSGTTTNSSASTCAFTIVDDEEREPAVVSFSDAVYSAAGDSVTVTVNRSGAMNTVVSAAVKTTGEGTAQAGRDYSEVDTELVFPFGVDHLSVEIPVRTEYLSGEGDFALTLEPVAGCTVGENASATAVLFGSYTGKASLTAQGTRALSSPSAGSITNEDAIIKNNLSTYKTLDEIDLSQPYYHGTAIGSDFEGKDYYVDSGKYYETMWKGDGRGVVGVIYALCDDEDPLVSYYLAGAEVTWDRSYGCGDPAWIKVGIAGNDIFSLETDAKTPNDDSYDYWFPYDSTRSFDTETRYIYPHKNAVDYSAWSRKGFGGSYPRYIEILNYANCEDCSWLHIKSIKPILRPILVTVEPIAPLSYIQEDGTVAEDTKAVNAEIVDGGTSAVYFMDDSITVRASTEVGVLQYGYLAGLQLVDSDGDPITTIASNEDPTVNSITYTFNTENMGKLVSQRWSVTDVVTQLLIRSNADYANPYQENRDGLPTFLSYKLKPQYSYADAMVNLHNPYEFPVTMTISGRDYTLAAGQTLVLRHDDRPIHKGDTLAVSRITLGGANSELYTPVGVRYSGKFQSTDLKPTEGTWDFVDNGAVYVSGSGDHRLNFSEITIEPNLQDKNNRIMVRVRTEDLPQFETSGDTAGFFNQRGVEEGDYTYFVYANEDATFNGRVYAITATPRDETAVSVWYDPNTSRFYEGNTLYFTAGNTTERNVITLFAETATTKVNLTGTLKYANYNLRTGYAQSASNVPAVGATIAAGSAGGVADTKGSVAIGPIYTTGKTGRYLRYIVSVNGYDQVKELYLTSSLDEPSMLFDFGTNNAASIGGMGKKNIAYSGKRDVEGNDFYEFSYVPAQYNDPAYVTLCKSAESVQDIQWVKMRVKNLSAGIVDHLELYSCCGYDRYYNSKSLVRIDIAQDSEWHEYTFNIVDLNRASYGSGANEWAGNVKFMQLFPLIGLEGRRGVPVQIDYIAFFPTEEQMRSFTPASDNEEPNLLWDFGEDEAMSASMGAHQRARVDYAGEKDAEGNDYYTFTSTNGNDPYVSVDMGAANVDLIQWVKIRARNLSGAECMELYACTQDYSGPNGNSRVPIPLKQDTEWHDYYVHISDFIPKDSQRNLINKQYDWYGKINWIRLDPMEGNLQAGSQVQIDYVAFFPKQENAEAFRPTVDANLLVDYEYTVLPTMTTAFTAALQPKVTASKDTEYGIYMDDDGPSADESYYYIYNFKDREERVVLSLSTPISDASKTQWALIRAQNAYGQSDVYMELALSDSPGEPDESTRTRIDLIADREWHDYLVDLSKWSGSAEYVELFPIYKDNITYAYTSVVAISKIAYFESEEDARAYTGVDSMGMGVYDSHNVTCTLEQDYDGNSYCTFTATGSDPHISLDDTALDDASQARWVKIRARNLSGANCIELFACTGSNTRVYADSNVQIALKQDAEWHDYIVNIGQWLGRINWIRLDPIGDAAAGDQIQIDYIAFFGSEDDAKSYRSPSIAYETYELDISAVFSSGINPVSSPIFQNITITGEMTDKTYQLDGGQIPVVLGKGVNMTVAIKPSIYSYSYFSDGAFIEDTTTENPLSIQFVVYDQNDVFRGEYAVADDPTIKNKAFTFKSLLEFVEPGEGEQALDADGKPLYNADGTPVYEEGEVALLPEPGDRLYIRLVTDRLAQTSELKNKGDPELEDYQYTDIYTGYSFYQPTAYKMPPPMSVDTPIEIEYGNLPFVGSTGMDLAFPFVNVGIMKIYHGYRIYFGVSPVQIADTIKGTHLSSMSGAGGSYWKSIFKVSDPFGSFAQGIKEAADAIKTVRDLNKELAANNEKKTTGNLGSPSWKFDLSIGMYFDFLYATTSQNTIASEETHFVLNGLGGYLSVTLGFQTAWYIILPVVFLPAYLGLEMQGTVMGFLGATFNKSVTVDYDDSLNGKATIKDGISDINGCIRGSAFVQISFGIGLCGTLGARIAGKVEMLANWEPTDPNGDWGFFVKLKVGGIIDLFLFSIPIMFSIGDGWAFGSFEYYKTAATQTVPPPNQRSTLQLRESSGEDSMWLGDQMMVRGAFQPNKDQQKLLAIDAYERPDSQLITLSDGKTVVLAFIDSDNAKGAAQRTTLKMATYNADTGLWSEAVTVSGDDTADFQPSIAETRDGKVLVAWVSPSGSAVDLSTDAGVMTYLNSMEVYAAFVELDGSKQIVTKNDPVYGVCADTEVTRITNDHYTRDDGTVASYYDSNPTVVCDMESGDAMIYYIKSGRSSLGDGQITDYINPYTNDCVVCYMPFNAAADVDTDGRTVPAGWLTGNFYFAELDGVTEDEDMLIQNFGGQRFLDGALNANNERYTIPDFTAIGYNGLAVYAYTVDTDGSNDTDADKELYLQVYNFENHETKFKILLTDDNVSDALPQFFRSKVNTETSGGYSTDAENTHTKLFWYRDGKQVVYIDVTALLRDGINTDGTLKTEADDPAHEYTYVENGRTHYRYTDPRPVFVPTADSNAAAQSADFKAVEDSEGNLYVLWTESVTDEDGNAAREIFGSGFVEYQVSYEAENGDIVTYWASSGWSKPYQITRDGFHNDEMAVAMSGENLIVVHNRYREELLETDTDYNGQVDFMPIQITDLALVSDTLEPCGSVETESISLYRVTTTTVTEEDGSEIEMECRTPVTLPVGGEQVSIEVEVANNGMNIADGYKLSLYADETLIDEVEVTDTLAPNTGAVHYFDYTLPADVSGLTFKAVSQEMRDATYKLYYNDKDTFVTDPLEATAAYKITLADTYQAEDGFHAKFTVTNTGNAASSSDDTLSVKLWGPANLADQFTEEETSLYKGTVSLGIGESRSFDVPVSILPEMMEEYGFVMTLISVQKQVVAQTIGTEQFMSTNYLSNLVYADFDLAIPMNMTLQNVTVGVDDSAAIAFSMELGDQFRGGGDVTYAVDDMTVASVDNGKVVGVNGGTTTLHATHVSTGATVSATVTVTGERTIEETDLEIQPTEFSMEVGNSHTITYKTTRNGTPTFTSSDTGVVTVDEDGNMKAVGTGTAIITVKLTDAVTGLTYAATCTVTVTEAGSSTPVEEEPYVPAAPSDNAIVVTVSGDEGSVSVSAAVEDDTATVTAPTEEQIAAITDRAGETGSVTIDLSSLPENITAVVIPAETVKAIDEAMEDNGEGLTIRLPNSAVTFDAEALQTIAAQTEGADLKLNVEPIAESDLNGAQQAAADELDMVAIYDIYLTSGDKRITDFGIGRATVTVEHTLGADRQPGGLVAWYLAEDGAKTKLPTSATAKDATFTVPHFSYYALAYDETRPGACDRGETCPMSAFYDLDKTAWYHDGVHWALENGIMDGVGAGKFNPTGTTNRAMIVTMLHRLEGEPTVNYDMSFADVADGKWYTEAIRWAAANGIVEGYSDEKFGPTDDLKREQLAAILYRYAKMKGQGFTGMWAFPLNFDDASDVSDWAYEAMCWMTMQGVIEGTGVSRLSPKGNATRAQVATMLMRFDAIEQ